MTDRELMQKWLQPGAIVPVDVNTVRILIDALRERLAQPEQEPVAWISKHGVVYPLDAKDEVHPINDLQPLYAIPPRREWVGLTDEEVKTLPQWFPSHETAAVMPMIRAIEAKLKEKNA